MESITSELRSSLHPLPSSTSVTELSEFLTCSGAFDIHGLDFESDTVVWAVLANAYFAVDKSICRPMMTAETFIRVVSDAGFVDDVSGITRCLSKAFAIGHYVSAHLCCYRNKKNTLISYIRQLCKIANSIFGQMVILRYVGECYKNEYLKAVFDILPNPIDEYGALDSTSVESLYESYSVHLDFVSKALCDCRECADRVPIPLRQVVCPWIRRGRRHRFSNDGVARSMRLANIGHLDERQVEVIRSNLANDMLQQTIYDAVDDCRLPLRLNTDRLGRGFLEKSVLVLVYNVTFILFLIVRVNRTIRTQLEVCRDEFLRYTFELQGYLRDEVVIAYVRDIVKLRVSAYEMPNVMISFMIYFRNVFYNDHWRICANHHRQRIIMEQLMMIQSDTDFLNERIEVRLARCFRRRLLSDPVMFRHHNVYCEPDMTVVDPAVFFDVTGLLVFRAPMWFAYPSRNEVVLEMAGDVFRRRLRILAADARAERTRENLRVVSSFI
nr:MAG: protein m30 [Herpesviridae sp.]